MPAPVDISISADQIRRLSDLLTPRQVRQAIYQAVSRTTRAGRTRFRKRVRHELKIPARAVSRNIRQTITGGEAPAGVLTITGEPIPLADFGARGSKRRGVRVTVARNRPPLRLSHAFVATMKTGHKGVFSRRKLSVFGPSTTAAELAGLAPETIANLVGPGRNRAVAEALFGRGIRPLKRLAAGGNFPRVTADGYAWRLPIQEHFGPSVLSVFGEEATTQAAQEEIGKLGDTLQRNLESQIDRFLKRGQS